MPLANPWLFLIASRLPLNFLIGVQTSILIALAKLLLMTSSVVVCSLGSCHMETCWYIRLPSRPSGLNTLLLVGVARAVRHMKCSQRSWFVIITQRSQKRQSFLPPQSWIIQKACTSISIAPLPLPPCLSYTIILPSKTNMTRILRKSTDSLIACRRQVLLEHI